MNIHKRYYDKIGDDNSLMKSKNVSLEREALRIPDNLIIYGSSEFEFSRDYWVHVSKFFDHRAEGFQVHLYGRAGYEQIAHSVNFGALGKELKKQKIAFVISPQWFAKQNADEKTFSATVSRLQYLLFFLDKDLSFNVKQAMALRISKIVTSNKYENFNELRHICSFYANDDIMTRISATVAYPYYWAVAKILEINDELAAYKVLKKNKVYPRLELGEYAEIDWQEQRELALRSAQEVSKNNELYMDDFGYSKQMEKTPHPKGLNRKVGLNNPELYNELEDMLEILKELDLDPLFINIPFNGYWSDLTELRPSERRFCYEKVYGLIKKYNFKLADFTDKEYEPYFFKDASHIGWIGWIYVNEAIYNYFYNRDAAPTN
jgi:D-alanine transfer protein